MRRYWKLIGIVTVVVLTIGTFYIQSAIAKANYPTFHIETISGDEQLTEDLVINGEYQEKGEVVYPTITKDGTYYQEGFTLFDVVMGGLYSNKLQELQKEYRNFMRGKEDFYSFAENEEILVSVNSDTMWSSNLMVNEVTFEVEVLQKDSKVKTTFDIPVSKEEDMDNLFISKVNVLNDMIQVVTNKSVYVDGNYEEYLYVYRLDIATKKLLSETVIDFPGIQVNADAHPSLMDSDHDNQTKLSLFVSEEFSEPELAGEEYLSEKISRELVLYNQETDTQEIIELPEEIKLDFNPELYMDQTIYFTEETEDTYQIIGYNIDDKQIETNYTIELNDKLANINIDGEYVYMYSPIKSKPMEAVFTISEIKTGDILYEGSIGLDSNEGLYDTHLDITYIMRD